MQAQDLPTGDHCLKDSHQRHRGDPEKLVGGTICRPPSTNPASLPQRAQLTSAATGKPRDDMKGTAMEASETGIEQAGMTRCDLLKAAAAALPGLLLPRPAA